MAPAGGTRLFVVCLLSFQMRRILTVHTEKMDPAQLEAMAAALIVPPNMWSEKYDQQWGRGWPESKREKTKNEKNETPFLSRP